MTTQMLRYLLTLLVLFSISQAVQAAKPNLVLLPLVVSEQEAGLASEYGVALQQGLEERYNVFYGAMVEKQLEKEYDKVDCSAEACNQNIAIAFNGELVADGSVKAISGGYLLKLVIKNVISGKAIESKTIPCRGCDIFSVVDTLKQMGSGKPISNTPPAVTRPSQISQGGSSATQMATDSRAILIFDSQPSGADVVIGGQVVGKTPYQGMNHKMGEKVDIEVKASQYRPYTLSVTLNQAITQLEPVKLEAGIAKLMILTEPYRPNAVLYIDGQAKGKTPLQLDVATGNHEMYAIADGKKTEVKAVVVNDGDNKQLVLSFSVQSPLLAKLGIEMVDVPAGNFRMGSGESYEKPIHSVTLSAFQIGKYEVTQGQWQAVMGANPSYFKKCGDNCPVEEVSWDDIQTFLKKLNQQTGDHFRLPTEAEWEYACRSGGKDQTYCGGNNLGQLAWFSDNSNSTTHAVGQKQANGLGIYDMSGNVWEWVQDWYGDYSSGNVADPTGASSGSRRVSRGGSLVIDASYSRSAFRDGNSPDARNYGLGFRLVR